VYIKRHFRRIDLVVSLLLLFFCIILAKVIFTQLFSHNYLKNLSLRQHNLFLELEPKRGIIYDRNLNSLAINLACDSVYAVPKQIKDKEKTVNALAQVIDLDKDFLAKRIFSDKGFIWLERKLPDDKSRRVKSLGLKGIEFIKENKRSYPNSRLLSNVLGFAGLDNVGLEGLELYYNEYLKGRPGWCQILRDAKQNTVLYENLVNPVDGYDLVLTIDEVIQFVVEKELEEAFQKYHAKAATAIVMDPKTGEILAWATRPNYDLNNPSRTSQDERRNRGIADMFEPGSVFKTVTASAALEENKFSEADKIFCENGSYKIAGGHILHDHTSHGWLTFSEVIMQSSNIGVAKIAQTLGAQTLYKYIKNFGFGDKTGIDLFGEINGSIKDPRNWSKTSLYIIPFGQEVGVTALQLCREISVIANGGILVNPHLVSRIQDKNQQLIKEYAPGPVKRVISENTAKRMRGILARVVAEGTGVLAQVKDFPLAGKTGTAQKLEPNGTYSHNKFIATFIGFAPADEPKLAMVVMLDEPHPQYYGGVVAAPVFKNVSAFAVKYLQAKSYNLPEGQNEAN